MLKFLTHKLRTHSLNEENVSEKVDEHDSGTESDDEVPRPDSSEFCTDAIMKWSDITDISEMSVCGAPGAACGGVARLQPDPDPLYDHHSSEEELEVINGAPSIAAASRRRVPSPQGPGAPAPEKRKWSAAPPPDHARAPSSSDDDTKVETPVRFRTSPPLEALKPRRSAAGAPAGEPPLKLAHLTSAQAHCEPAASSPRRVRPRVQRRQRPALDFDKMQQLRVRGVTSWRHHGGSHGAGGELSVFCW